MATKKHNEKGLTGACIGNPWITAVDLSTLPSVVAARQRRVERRREQFRASQQKRRIALRASGSHTVQVVINNAEFSILNTAATLQNGPLDDFWKRALLVGAKFLANSGNVKGGKVRLS